MFSAGEADITVITTDTLILAAAVKTLKASPVAIIAAPGAAKYTEFLGCLVYLDAGSTGFTDAAGEDMAFSYTNAAGKEVGPRIDGTELDGTTDVMIWIPPIGGSIATPAVGAFAMVANAAIVAHILVGEWADGDGDISIRALHRTHLAADMLAIT